MGSRARVGGTESWCRGLNLGRTRPPPSIRICVSERRDVEREGALGL